MKQPDERNEHPQPTDPQTTTHDPDLDSVFDPCRSPPQVALFDATNFDRWIQTDEDLLIDLVTMIYTTKYRAAMIRYIELLENILSTPECHIDDGSHPT